MRIAIVRFPINDVGGIDSYYVNLKEGLQRAGHRVWFYHATHQTRKKVGYKTAREYVHEGDILSYREDEDIAESLQILEWFDVVIFLHPSPHPVKGLIDQPWAQNWMMFYELTQPKIIQIHHDENWDKTNEWCDSVAERCDYVVAAQHRFLPAVERYPNSCPQGWHYFPLDIPDQEPRIHSDGDSFRGIIATQWLQWKGHRHFIPLLPDLSPSVTIDFYGAGIQYHYLLRDGELDGRIGMDHHANANHGGRHSYHGFVEYQEVMNAMAEADFSIDLSSRGYTNMTHWEPLMFGTIPFMHSGVADDPYNEIPNEVVRIYEDYTHLIQLLNEFEYDPKMAKTGYDFVRATSDCEDVARSILEAL